MRPAQPTGWRWAPHLRTSIPALPRRIGGRSRRGMARVFPGDPQQVAAARRWVAALAGIRGANAGDVGLVASELVTNAIIHTRSGQPGGTITIAITNGPGQVTIHIHDLGTSTGQQALARPAATGGDGLAEGGRGLQVVTALGVAWGTRPAACCPASRPSDLAATADGCCTWCTLERQPHGGGDCQNCPEWLAHGDRDG